MCVGRDLPSVTGMRLHPRILLPVLLVAGLAALTGCTLNLDRNTLVDGITAKTTVTEVHLGDTGSGDVSVVVKPSATETDVKRTVHYGGSAPAQTARVEGSTLVLEMRCGNNCSVSYDVTLPAPAKVTGANSSGDLVLTGVSAVDVSTSSGNVTVGDVDGPVTASATSGDVDITNVTGPAQLRTTSGNITARGLSGSTDAQAISGDITVDFTSTVDLRAKTTSGNIDVRVPGGPYHVTTKVTSGDVTVNIPTDPAAEHSLNLEATSGDINVNAAG
jgi:DUF4097 and DUF4098 domain-containing protein YvlB